MKALALESLFTLIECRLFLLVFLFGGKLWCISLLWWGLFWCRFLGLARSRSSAVSDDDTLAAALLVWAAASIVSFSVESDYIRSKDLVCHKILLLDINDIPVTISCVLQVPVSMHIRVNPFVVDDEVQLATLSDFLAAQGVTPFIRISFTLVLGIDAEPPLARVVIFIKVSLCVWLCHLRWFLELDGLVNLIVIESGCIGVITRMLYLCDVSSIVLLLVILNVIFIVHFWRYVLVAELPLEI